MSRWRRTSRSLMASTRCPVPRPAISPARLRRMRRAQGCGRWSSSRRTSNPARSALPAHTAPPSSKLMAPTTTSTGSAPSWPTSTAGRSSTSTFARSIRKEARRSPSKSSSNSAGRLRITSWSPWPPAHCWPRRPRRFRSWSVLACSMTHRREFTPPRLRAVRR